MQAIVGMLPPFYTARYVEVHNPLLSLVWFLMGLGIVVYTLVHSLLGQHNYVHREQPNIDVTFWQDRATDGNWWPQSDGQKPEYCGIAFKAASKTDNTSWGSDAIGCQRPGDRPGTYFYPSSNEIQIAFSVAFGTDPQFNTSDIYVYERIEDSTVGLQLSYITSRQHVAHVPNCRVIGDEEHPDGNSITSRYGTLFPSKDYGDGYLILSVHDVLKAAGRNLSGTGSEGPLILTGLEIVAKFDVRNYHTAFRWPFETWNPFGFVPASDLECTVRFEVLRDQFTPLQWFYHGVEPMALQHGLRLVAVGTGSIGYFSFVELIEKLLLGVAAFSLAQVVLDLGWYYLFSEADSIASHAYQRVQVNHGKIKVPMRRSTSGNLPFNWPLAGKML
eukprot:TRINITY_DN29245_c0_g1_i2.p1 TRINITY_DN29245_c0_g1~~TRINITY_DN29245_c0_g1_i2.p1  ORF type:complete len:388 (+),score=37.82 TRINITY_DN29245_c0_g1_i2:27-1190(+)